MSQTEGLSQELVAILGRFPGPVAIRPSRWMQLAFLSPGFLLAVVGIWLLLPGLPLDAMLVIGRFIAVPIGLLGALIAFSFVTDLPRITLDAEGFGLWGIVGAVWIPWRDAERFNSRMGIIVFVRKPLPEGLWGRINAWRMVPGRYLLKSKEIACLMTAWRERALTRSD